MKVVNSIAGVRAHRPDCGQAGFVPTMGFLHEGHLSLVRTAKEQCGSVIVSIFVNPTQFGPNEDLDRYPRALERDTQLLREAGADMLFVPDAREIYPPGWATVIQPGPVAERFEGGLRPGHFEGVATVVTKLFQIVQPQRAYFGQKDAQQCAVIRQIVRDLNIPVEIVVCDIMREASGLAMSSRNSYLTDEQKARAADISLALVRAREIWSGGERRAEVLRAAALEVLATHYRDAVDYLALVDADTFEDVSDVGSGDLMITAVREGTVRLLDNIVFQD
ncbi:pantoate--beta-alanine ligase [Acetobacter sp. AN02]|uniref:pantoate--beta-alanine ligase n=1 Tax=Acetobacter sp. AN02 TaxID=2894186 RepID=UPI0024343A63|nr:pantoate--beta-alanine ligase [Acetobacter sp. AN02]MDG6093588.1 pantoate--beta-alanine ligase [Acetobacter sp. AN02]